jgi:hypothetical protein
MILKHSVLLKSKNSLYQHLPHKSSGMVKSNVEGIFNMTRVEQEEAFLKKPLRRYPVRPFLMYNIQMFNRVTLITCRRLRPPILRGP